MFRSVDRIVVLCGLAAALLGAVYGFHRVGDPDVFQQVAVGRAAIADPGSIGTSTFHPDFPSYAYVADKWLASVTVAVFDAAWPGGDGIAVYQLLLAVAVALAWFVLYRSVASAPAALLGVAVTLLAEAFRVGPRPGTWSLALLALTVAAYLRSPRPAILLAIVVPIQVLWVNAHGYFVSGILVAIAAAFAVVVGDRAVPALARVGPGLRRRATAAIATVAGVAAASLVHPQGWAAAAWPVRQLLELRDAPAMRRAILEIQPTASLFEGAGAWHGFLAVATVAAAAWSGWARGPRAGAARRLATLVLALPWLLFPPSGLTQWPYRVAVALVVAAALELGPAMRRGAWFAIALFGGFLVLAVPIVRNVELVPPFAMLLALPAWDPWRSGAAGPRARRIGVVVAVALVAAVAAARGLDRIPSGPYRAPERFGWGVDRELVPAGAVDAWLERPSLGPVLNTFDHGGYLLYRLHPSRGAFIAGNTSMYPPEFLAAYRDDLIESDDPSAAIRRLGFRSAILGLSAPEASPLVRALARDPFWRLRHVDAGGALFVLDGASDAAPSRSSAEVVAEVARRWLEAPPPRGSAYPDLNRAIFLRDAGRAAAAARLWSRIADARPDAHVVAVGASIAESAGSLADFVPVLEDALERRPGAGALESWSSRARFVRGVARLEAGDTDGAIEDLGVASDRSPAAAGPRLALAAAYARAGRVPEARQAMAEALRRSTDGSVRRAAESDPLLRPLLP